MTKLTCIDTIFRPLRPFLIVMTCMISVQPHAVNAGSYPEIAVVTHRGNDIDSVDREELGRLFLSLSNSIAGVRLKAVNLSEKDLKLGFLERITMMSARQIEDHFIRADLRGEGKWPPEVFTSEEMVRLIVKSRNVVGWIPVSDLEALREKYRNAIKVIAVDGLNPGDDGYPLGPADDFD